MTRHHNAYSEGRKLLFSVGTNFLTRVPSAICVLWYLPLLRFGLGTDGYASLLAAIALGNAAAFLFGGFGVVGRRVIGQAFSDSDPASEADGFISLVVANLVAFGLAVLLICAYCWAVGAGTGFLVVASFSAFGLFLNTFDNVRAAYNEHYITATLQVVFQTVFYAVGFAVPATRQDLFLGSLVLQGHYMLASVVTCCLLLRTRPYLMKGRAVAAWQFARQGVMLAIADGFIIATLSFSVVWLQASASSATAAWFATMVRLFQTFLVPVILLLLPVSSYARILWSSKSVEEQQAFAKTTLLAGLGYGAVVAIGLVVASHFYVGTLLRLAAPSGLFQFLPSFLLFGAIVAYRTYSSVAFLVLDEPVRLSLWIAAVIGGAVMLGAVSGLAVAPLDAINVYALAAALSTVAVLCWNVSRFVKPASAGVVVPKSAAL